MAYKLNGREVEIIDSEYDDGSVMVLGAHYCDEKGDEDLTEEECLQLEETYQAELCEDYMGAATDRAYDAWKDREWDDAND